MSLTLCHACRDDSAYVDDKPGEEDDAVDHHAGAAAAESPNAHAPAAADDPAPAQPAIVGGGARPRPVPRAPLQSLATVHAPVAAAVQPAQAVAVHAAAVVPAAAGPSVVS